MPAVLAGALLALTAGILVAAGPPDGLGHGNGNPLGPPAANLHAHTDGHGHDRDADAGVTGTTGGPVHGAAPAPPGLGQLRADLGQVTAAVLAIADSDLMPPRNRHRPGAPLDSPAVAATPDAAASTPPAGASFTPATGGATAPRRASARPSTPAAPRPGVVVPTLPGVTLIPPASLPSPATFVPAAPVRGVVPVLLIAGAVALAGGVVGLRILRRPG